MAVVEKTVDLIGDDPGVCNDSKLFSPAAHSITQRLSRIMTQREHFDHYHIARIAESHFVAGGDDPQSLFRYVSKVLSRIVCTAACEENRVAAFAADRPYTFDMVDMLVRHKDCIYFLR